jgi:protocatechuate 3,4-dioxygenase beta subunit
MRRAIVPLLLLLAALGFLLLSSPGRVQTGTLTEPPSQLVPLSGPEEPGEKLEFWGRVLDYRGRPLSKAAVVAYHTDRTGLYNSPDGGTRVPRLRGVSVTDEAGRFGFTSIRPAAYPNGSDPAHIHMVVTAPAHQMRYVEYWFSDDPLVTKSHRERADQDPALVIVQLSGDAKQGWKFSNDIQLEGD